MSLSDLLRCVRVLGQPAAVQRWSVLAAPQCAAPLLTAADVLEYLSQQGGAAALSDTARARLDALLATLPQHLWELRQRREVRGLESYVERLPLIVTHYARGHTCGEIARMLGAMATDYGVHTALTLAAAFIAHRINCEAAS